MDSPSSTEPNHGRAGHQLGAGQDLVGHVACRGHGGGHTTWHCTRCSNSEPPIYGPPFNIHCTVLAGPAAVRISKVT
jgi:hypothetical protein